MVIVLGSIVCSYGRFSLSGVVVFCAVITAGVDVRGRRR